MERLDNVILPPPLREGDRIAIVSPAGIARPQNVYGALRALAAQGWEPEVSAHAMGRCGTFSGTPDERYADMAQALTDPSVRAVICTRGGYGAVHLLERLSRLPLRDDPKWLVGFSDISALHALFWSRGIVSIHGSMTKRLAQTGGDDPQSRALFALLRGGKMHYRFEPHPLNREGCGQGRLVGGNLSVLAALAATPYDVFRPGTILFIEDIAEPVYKIERVMMQLRLRGVLDRLAGLVVGQFTSYTPDVNHESMEAMISAAVGHVDYPVAFGVPVGHVDGNVPLLAGVDAVLSVDSSGASLFTE